LAKLSNADYDTTWLSITGGLSYQGSWNASTNTPTLTSGAGTAGTYYVVSVSGSTNLDGITDWVVGDWAIFNGTTWQKIDQTNLVTSVAGRTGAVTLTTADIGGLGTIATQNANAVAITGGAVDGTTLGATTRSSIAGTTELIGPAASANFTRFPNALSVVSNTASGIQHNESAYIGQMAEGVSVGSTWGVGVYGAGYTNASGTGRGTGVTGEGHVSTAADTGVAVGVRGYAIDTHTGNYNIGLYGDAENGDTGLTYGGNVSLFLANGNIVTSSAAAKSWYLGGNLIFDGQGSTKTISATNGAVISVSSGVTGTLPVANGGTGQTSYTDGQLLIGNSTGNTLTKTTLTAGSGISITNGAGSISISATGSGTVTSVTGTSPVVSSGGATPDISLASGYGDTQNPYASKSANYILAAPNGSTGVPTFRPLAVADVPTLNQNTTGTAANVTGIVAVANGGTGTTTPSLVAGSNITVTGTWPNQTIASTGGSSATPIIQNLDTVSSNQTIASGSNGFSVGPMTIASGYTVTVASGQRYVVL
jgi:hypothetical protein